MRFRLIFVFKEGTQWLRHCATNRKVADSIPDGVIGIFYWYNPSGRTMVLGLTQPLTEMSMYQEYCLGIKASGAYSWQTCHLLVPIVLKSGNLNLLEPSGTGKACNGIALPFFFVFKGLNKCNSTSTSLHAFKELKRKIYCTFALRWCSVRRCIVFSRKVAQFSVICTGAWRKNLTDTDWN
jgi:hypothetical protein